MTCYNTLIFLKNKDRLTHIKKRYIEFKENNKRKSKDVNKTTKLKENARHEGLNFFPFVVIFHSRMENQLNNNFFKSKMLNG